MIRKIETILMIGLVASLLVLIESSSGNPIQNELLEELKAELRSLRIKVDLLEARNMENVNLLTTQISRHEMKISKQEEEITKLKANIDSKQEASHPSAASDDKLDLNPNNDKTSSTINKKESLSGQSSIRVLAPSSCRELSVAGHYSNGLYLIQNLDTKKIETVLCTFGTSVSQDLIGQIDLKTQTVHFYVQRNSTFDTSSAVIPFELERLNEGDAFNLPSGIFTVPVPGIYHFDFSAVKSESATYLAIFLQVNGVKVGIAYTSDPSGTESYDTLSLSASFRLAAGDRVNLYSEGFGVLVDNSNRYTHFSGWLVEEELM